MSEAKLKAAELIVVDYIKENYSKTNWRYVDFVEEDRFLDEARCDENIDLKAWDAEEIAEYCLENICASYLMEQAQQCAIECSLGI